MQGIDQQYNLELAKLPKQVGVSKIAFNEPQARVIATAYLE